MSKPGMRRVLTVFRFIIGLWVCAWMAACVPVYVGRPAPTASTLPAPLLPTSTTVPVASATNIPTPTLSIATSTPSQGKRICSPFPGASQADLTASISNPYNPPPPGSDDPHQAVDLAVQQNGIALAGGPALAVLSGEVAMVTQDRFPYGYALLIETPLDTLPQDWLDNIQTPASALLTPAPTFPPNPALNCPAVTLALPGNEHGRSLYLLYAHLQEKAAFLPGETVKCGQVIGSIGQSGNALNPHLHLETRLGPSGARFSSMAHYDNTAQAEEMGNYCLWRVSNVFQLNDPLSLLAQLP